MRIVGWFCCLLSFFNKFLAWFAPLADLLIRAWLFKVFFYSGLTKIQNFDSTLALFKNEYHVPYLPSDIAAYLGTGAELIFPALMLAGLFGRLSAFGLFVFNIVAVISYPFLMTQEGAAGLMQHIYWGLLILVIVVHGPGKISLDHLMFRKCDNYKY